MHDKGAALGVVGFDQLIGDPESLAEVQSPRFTRGEHIGGALDQKAVALRRTEHAPQSRTGLEKRHLDGRIEFAQMMGRRQAGYSTTNDGNLASRSGEVIHGEYSKRIERRENALL